MTNRVVVALALLALCACKSTSEVIPGSERVRVFDAEPKGCLYVGEVSSVQEEKSIGTLETEMDLATRVDLRNKAHSLGGNILVFLKGKNTNTLPGSSSAKTTTKAGVETAKAGESTSSSESEKKEALVFIGTVFKCPSSILNQ